ncbi:hypothetical protein ACFPER_09780 [Agromyces aurantiacus]|uniref:Uncharacterized protein n=1 Tax=Agromyces aurantiacus TaxID=165814 RepID=A0ABV9R6H0_9MICO|nr:hypothetical protein [Agromyces aurantiacus]MBM7503763.1 hypothetical protein [Agromyces aurantiacus]
MIFAHPHHHHVRPTEAYDWPSLIVNAIAALGTVAAVVVTLVLAYRAWNADRLKRAANEAARLEAQALELHPGPGRMWWLIRRHEPAVRVTWAVRMRFVEKAPQAGAEESDQPDGDSEELIQKESWLIGDDLFTGTMHGFGVGLRVGDYVEVHWTEAGGATYANGVRIRDPNEVHYIANGQNGH